jgi:inward rectifier potassium channel
MGPIDKQRRPRNKIRKIEKRDGKFTIRGMGKWYNYWRDPYHLLLTIPWLGFMGIVSVSYLGINAIFALAYLAGGDCIKGATSGSFSDAFFFSVQTLASIGYGAMYPQTNYAHFVVTLEAIASLLAIAVVTGLAFARFSRPVGRVLFSKYALVTTYDRQPMLIFRLANERYNFILEANAEAYLVIDEITSAGEFMRRLKPLVLVRSRTPSLSLSWTVMHQIDANSPLYELTIDDLEKMHAQINVLMSGIDETVAYTIHTRHVYGTDDILFNHQFKDIIHTYPNGDRYFDYSDFHETEVVID